MLCLRPISVLIYAIDIVKSSDILKFIIFVDDMSIAYSAVGFVSLTRAINQELQFASTWLLANKLSLNIPKTKFLIFIGNKNLKYEI